MAKKPDKWESRHKQRLSLYQRRVDALYTKACRELSRITANLREYSPWDAFSFKNHPSIQQSVESVLNGLKSGVTTIIVDGVNSEWTLANDKSNELSRQVFGDNVGKLSQEQYRRYFSDNDEARKAFLARKENGLSLSDRVWNYTSQFKNEIELGLDIGLRNGLSADEMTRELKQYLKHPDKLFRRVRDERGVLQLSKAAADFHPGKGVYRSSYKNALRLAVTETNMAYRTADHDRIQTMDFVVGIRVVLSNNHTVNGMPLYDICDELSAPLGSTATKGRGCYPKDFKFTGWHPNCRCHVEFIQITQEEMDRMTQDTLDGKPWSGNSVNEVKDVPEEFKAWVQNNSPRIVKSNKLPYFMADNERYVVGVMQEAQPSTRISALMENNHFKQYIQGLLNSSDKYDTLYQQYINSGDLPDMQRAMIINQLKQEAASITHQNLRKAGLVGDNWVLSRSQFDAEVERGFEGYVANNVTGAQKYLRIQPHNMDLLIFKDTAGREFAYPVGATKGYFSAIEASKVIEDFPPYLKEKILRVTFAGVESSMNPYWEWRYNYPNFKAAATDGGKTTFFSQPADAEAFKGYMLHEAGHIIDGAKSRFSSSKGWREAVRQDAEYWDKMREAAGLKKRKVSVSYYAETSPTEDFAESIKAFNADPKWFKSSFPHRSAYIKDIAHRLSGHFPKKP